MGKYEVTDPDGNRFVMEARSPEEAYAALGEMKGGQPRNFDQAFNPSAPRNAAAERPELKDDIMGMVNAGLDFVKGGKQTQMPYSGSILPFSKDSQGNVSFDSNAGIVGAAKGLIGGIGDVMSGRVDPKSDQGIANITNAAMVGTPVSAATRGGLGWAGAQMKTRAPVATPTGEELLTTGGQQFDMARQMGTRYDPAAVNTMALNVRTQLLNAGFRKKNAPGTFAELKGLIKPPEPGAFATIEDLHAVRQALGRASQNFTKPSDQEAARVLIEAIDGFIQNPDPAAVMAGPAAAAGEVWGNAKGNYAAGKRSDRLVDNPFSLDEKAARRAAATNSGLNKDNTIRQRVASLLENPQTRSGFNTEEIALLETVANGTAPRNLTRFVGNLLGGGGGLAGAIVAGGTGLTFGGPVGAAVGVTPLAVGVGAKALGGRLTKNALDKSAERVRQRSPLYEERLRNAPAVEHASPATRSAVPRAAAMTKQQQEQYEEYLRQKWLQEQGA